MRGGCVDERGGQGKTKPGPIKSTFHLSYLLAEKIGQDNEVAETRAALLGVSSKTGERDETEEQQPDSAPKEKEIQWGNRKKV